MDEPKKDTLEELREFLKSNLQISLHKSSDMLAVELLLGNEIIDTSYCEL